MSTERLLWAIGDPDATSAELVDNYREPRQVAPPVWRVGAAEAQRWPLFHPSEADPAGGYRRQPYAVIFEFGDAPEAAYLLRLHYLIIAPRYGYVAVKVNGVTGRLYLRPAPALGTEIRVPAALHTSLYADGVAELAIPGGLLQQGENCIELVACDEEPVTQFDNPEKIARLDRMATGAGFIYRALQLWATAAGDRTLRRVDVVPTVLYRADEAGALWETCYLHAELNGPLPAGRWQLALAGGERSATLAPEMPAVPFGHVRQIFELFDGEGPVNWRLCGPAGDMLAEGELRRRRKWQVFVAPHAHTDIGYTHRQAEVAERLARNLDVALDKLARDGTPPAFAYHLDASWTLQQWLQTRGPARREQLHTAVRNGHVGIAANYAILLSQFAGLEELIRNQQFSADYGEATGYQPSFAAVVDVPSLSGSLPAVLQGCAVPYLLHAANQDRGPMRLLGGLHRHAPFYWEGTNGGQVLVWLAKMYCELRKVCGSPPSPAGGEQGLDLWLGEYERATYAPDAVLLYGQEADNTDLDPQPAEFVRQWNETYAFPRLIPSVVTDFFAYVETHFGAQLPTVRGDGGAYWEDGVGSSIAATVEARAAQAMLPAAGRLATLSAVHREGQTFPRQQFDAAWEQLLLYDEHTWGAFLSADDPDSLLQLEQWAVKEHMARDAVQRARGLLHAAVTRHTLSWNTAGREVVVFNPHSWPTSGPVLVEIGCNEHPVDAQTGERLPLRVVRTLATQRWIELWVEELPGLSYRRLPLRPGAPEVPVSLPVPGEVELANDDYRLVLDVQRGCVTSWYDHALGRELVDQDDVWGCGHFVYARGGDGTRLTGNRIDLPVAELALEGGFDLEAVTRLDDALETRVELVGRTAAGRLQISWSLYRGQRAVDASYTLHKESCLAKEAGYIAFPFALPGAEVLSDSQLGWVLWQTAQLPGGCKEWLPLQSGILLRDAAAAVHIASPDIPLFCSGDVVRGRWPRQLDLSGGRAFSYVFNNYWHTNYRAAQEGTFTFGYRLRSDGAIAPARAYRYGWEARQPPYAQRISLQEFREPAAPYDGEAGGTLARVSPAEVALVMMEGTADGGTLLRLQETGGAAWQATIAFPERRVDRAWHCDVLGRRRDELPVNYDGTLSIPVPAWGLATVHLEMS